MIKFIKTQKEHIEQLANNIGDIDKKEIYYASGLDPLNGILMCYALSPYDCDTALDENDNVLSIHGVMSKSNYGIPWMILAKDAYYKEGLKHSMNATINWVEEKMQKYKKLQNYISIENTNTIRWLKYLKFKIVEEIKDYGYCKKPFYKFERIS